MNRVSRLSVCLWAAALAILLRPAAMGAADEKSAGKDLIRQVNIMAKVLETRLREELGGDLVGPGLFQPGGVRGFAVPGIGAIFQLNVNFPVVEPKPPAQKARKSEDQDLWDRMEREEPAGPRAIRTILRSSPPPGPPPAPPAPPVSGVPPKTRPDKAGEARRGEVTAPAPGPIPHRDAARKIETLERVILETLAKYGERMTALGGDENIIVLVGGMGLAGGFPIVHPAPGHLPPAEPQIAEQVQESIKRLEGELRELQKKLSEMMREKKGREVGHAVAEQQKKIAELQAELAKARAMRATATAYAYRFEGFPYGGAFRMMPGPFHGDKGGSSWVLTVRKSDLAADPDALREKARIQKYAASPAAGNEAAAMGGAVDGEHAESP